MRGMSYPVQLDVTSPARFDRIQLVVRLAIALALGWIGITSGWLACLLFVMLPVVAAVVISTQGTETYVSDVGPRVWRGLAWLLALSAYMLLLVDRFPLTDDEQASVRVELTPTGRPSIGSALLRVITSLPSAFVLMLLGIVSFIMLVIGVVAVLAGSPIPESVLAVQRGYLRWQANLLAYHASLVDQYPPFSFDASVAPAPSIGAHDARTH